MSVDSVARPVMQALSAATSRSTKQVVRPAGMAHTRAAGPWPVRVLFVGCGIAAGDGVLTHDLAVPGHLARLLAADTSRGVDVDIVVAADMTATTALATLSRIRMSHYDAIVVVLGAADVAELTPVAAWGHDLRRLLGHIRDAASTQIETFVLALPTPAKPAVKRLLGRGVVDRWTHRINSEMAGICASTPSATLVVLQPDEAHSAGTTRATEVYREIGRQVATAMGRRLNVSPGSTSRLVDVIDEIARQRAVDELGPIDEAAFERLDRITDLARRAFDVRSAAVSIIDGQWQIYASQQNIGVDRIPRVHAPCSTTITGREALVIKDASIDPRFADNPMVKGEPYLRFYAGYPIEAPNGQPLGALCVMDDKPRDLSEEELIQLRTLALFAQDELWSEGYHYEREFGQRTADRQSGELLKSGFRLR